MSSSCGITYKIYASALSLFNNICFFGMFRNISSSVSNVNKTDIVPFIGKAVCDPGGHSDCDYYFAGSYQSVLLSDILSYVSPIVNKSDIGISCFNSNGSALAKSRIKGVALRSTDFRTQPETVLISRATGTVSYSYYNSSLIIVQVINSLNYISGQLIQVLPILIQDRYCRF